MSFPFLTPDTVTLPIRGSEDIFPVNHIYCVGRNYREHAREMGADEKKPPFFFSKPNWAISPSGENVAYPPNTNDLQHEVELVLAVGPEQEIYGFAVGVDLTRRDLQAQAKKDGKPWFQGKCFPGAAPVSEIVPIGDGTDLSDLRLELSVNGELRQTGFCGDMIWSPVEIVGQLKSEISLKAGDLIFSGTPSGVGTLKRCDSIVSSIPGMVEFAFSIV